ncbi:MAG: hypothetical protein M1833_003206 [Piccolia ochrophora]|nr:MAG: hypothetical protein M1833_003206 [Piccolia ochrophora]
MAEPTLTHRLGNYSFPAMLLVGSIAFHILTVIITFFQNPRRLFQVSQLRDDAFARFWLALFPLPPKDQDPEPEPNALPNLLASATGTVLELGPGNGTQTLFLRNSGLHTLYLAEPTLQLHTALRDTAERLGLRDRCHVLGCGAEPSSLIPALAREGAITEEKGEGIFDTIICARVLCCVPSQEDTVAGLYGLLKPGGRLIFREHVVSQGGITVGHVLQRVYMALGWSFWMTGCELTRDTGRVLKDAAKSDGGWAKVELEHEDAWGAVPFVTGQLVKK